MKFESKIIFSGILIFFCSGFIGGCGAGSYRPFTKAYIQQTTQNSSALPRTFEKTTYRGCEVVPATGNKPQFEGQEFTGDSCFIKIQSDERAEVSFLGKTTYPLSLLEKNSDTFVAQINNNEVLLVQLHRNEVISFTQTDYDTNNHLNYGVSGKGEFIKACLINAPSSCTYTGF